MSVSPISQAILIEAMVASTSLSSGFNVLRKAHGYSEGSLYSAFFHLSIGIERLMKVVVCLDKIGTGNISELNDKLLKSYGHGIIKLLEYCIERHNEVFSTKVVVDEDLISFNIVEFLDSFAKRTRYYNLDSISNDQTIGNPVAKWNEVMDEIFINDVSSTRKKQLLGDSEVLNKLIEKSKPSIRKKCYNQLLLGNVDDVRIILKHEFSITHCIWRIVALLGPVYSLLREYTGQSYRDADGSEIRILFLDEFFEVLSMQRESILRKREYVFHEWH